jgi:hypothetical protein
MNPNFCGRPTEEELRNRINRQIEWRGRTKEVALLWHGYLAALFEWNAIELDVYESLSGILPDMGASELVEIFSDEKNSAEREEEIERYRRKDPLSSK